MATPLWWEMGFQAACKQVWMLFSLLKKGKIKGGDCISKQGIVIYLRRF